MTRFINVSQVIALYGATPLIVARSPGVDNPATFAIQTFEVLDLEGLHGFHLRHEQRQVEPLENRPRLLPHGFARGLVAELVKRFSRNAATYRSPEYNETWARGKAALEAS